MRRQIYRLCRILILFVMLTGLSAGMRSGGLARAQTATRNPQSLTDNNAAVDGLQRSYRLDNYQVLANDGAGRGENIYKYKYWVCHHQYQKDGPDLKDLYKRANLMSGATVDDNSVTAQIISGGPGMPSFRTTLSDRDVADVVSY